MNVPGWSDRLPETVGEAFDEWLDRFGSEKGRVRDLLRPLAFAEGGGLPWESLWPAVATAIAGRPYGDSDVEGVLEDAGAFVIEIRQEQRSAYRLFHEALAEHLRPPDRLRAIQGRITEALLETVPQRAGRRDWPQSMAYVRTHLATHAANGDALAELLDDPGFLVAADQTRLLKGLSTAGIALPESAARTSGQRISSTLSPISTAPATSR